MSNNLRVDKRRQIFHLLCEGNGLRSVSRVVGCSINTVSELQKRFSMIVDFMNRKYIKELDRIQEIEADEIRTIVHKKTNVKWVYIAMDRSSRLIIHFHIGKRDTTDARAFIKGLSQKLNYFSKQNLSTDCLKSYVSAIKKSPNGYQGDQINVLRAATLTEPLPRSITNRIETHNGNVRQHVARLTRRSRCISKKQEGLRQHLSLFFFYYNFIKVHKALKTSPAVAAGLIPKKMDFEELLAYDQMFRDNFSSVDKNDYGRIQNKVSLDEQFIAEMQKGYSGIKKGNARGKTYNKLKVVA